MVIGCTLLLESRAWNIALTVHGAGFELEMFIRHRFPCRSPAYTRFKLLGKLPLLEFTRQ